MEGIPSTRHKSAPLKPCCSVWPTSVQAVWTEQVQNAETSVILDVYWLAGKGTEARTYSEYLSSPSALCLNTEIKESRAVTTRRLSAQKHFRVRTSRIVPCLLEILLSSTMCIYLMPQKQEPFQHEGIPSALDPED